MARPFDIRDIVRHRLLGWQGLVLAIYPREDPPTNDGAADCFIEATQELERRVLISFLERVGGPELYTIAK